MRVVVPFLMLLVSLCGCSCSQQEKKPAVLRINFQDGDLPSTHPHVGIDYRIRSLQAALFEGLIRLDGEGKVQPAAAEEISISTCKTIYTFKLRPSTWSNGEKVTAYHFATAWKQAIAKNSFCRRPDLFYLIKNAEKVKKGECDPELVGIKALSEETLEVVLEHPAPYFLELISNPIFSPLFDGSEEPQVFNGPFIINEWKHDRLITLKKNPLYWDAKEVQLEGIDIFVITDPLTAVQLFEKNELDWIGSPFSCLPSEMIPSLEKKGELKRKDVARIYWLYCNTEIAPFNNSSIRKALSLAIDRQAIVEHVLLGQSAATSPLPNSLTLLCGTHQLLQVNEELARTLLAEGMKELGYTEENFPPITLAHSHIAGQRQLAEIIQSNWNKILGLDVHLSGSEWNLFFSDLSKGQYQVGGCIKSALFRDPIYHLELLQDKNHSYNLSRWEDTTYQDLLLKARTTTDLAERNRLLQEAELILVDQMPVIPIYSESYLYMMRPHVKGIVIHDLGHVDFKWGRLEP
jgi:oligopeptide transport system substrate-binding protein